MKWRLILACTLFSCTAMAADQPPAAAPAAPPATELKPAAAAPQNPNIEIVDGKKFFSLKNARRFTSPRPGAQQVINHPRPIITRGTVSTNADNDTAVKVARPATPPSTGNTPASSTDALSVFVPDESGKPISPAAPLNAPPAR